ncbi:anthranilate phosphoribosyltransferase, partial [bacterium]|nr:anthranilate phosphoribosyltransferase [bacterium]
DVLKTLGAKIDLSPDEAEKCLNKTGMAFLFAPMYHASMKHAVVPRRELGVRTVFNILGPMSNPARTKRQVIGAFNLETAEKMVQVLQKNGSEHVMVVHSTDGMDEISLSAPTHVFELKNDSITHYQIKPDDFRMIPAPMETIRGGSADENAATMRGVFQGSPSPIADIISLNAGAAIYVSGRTPNLADGVKRAQKILQSGAAAEKLNEFILCTNTLNQN